MNTRKLLLKAADISNIKGEEKIHFLNLNAVRINKSLGDAVGLKNIGIHLVQVDPGKDTTEYHKHYYEEEGVYILAGQGMLEIEGEQYQIEQGDFVGFPSNTAAHTISNNGTVKLVCLVMGQRLEQDVTDYPKKAKRLYRNSGEWNIVDMKNIIDPKK